MKSVFNILFVALIFVQSACVKHTSISGTVSDKATGMPLEGVKVSMSAIKYKSENDKAIRIILGSDQVITGPDGRYFLEIDTKRPNELGMGALKDGYVHVWTPPRWGSANTFDFEMNPIDAGIRLTIKNESGFSGKTYALVYERDNKLNHFFYPWPVILNKGDSLSSTLHLSGGAFAEVRCGTNSNLHLPSQGGVQIDSVYCPRNDTVEYLLKL